MIKLFDSEFKIMEVLWKRGDTSAKAVADQLAAQVGWSKTTTYTLIGRCIQKGVIERREPGYICHALLSQDAVQTHETNELIDKLYGGSADRLVTALIEKRRLSEAEIARLRQMIEEMP